jgi:hypothetical protein
LLSPGARFPFHPRPLRKGDFVVTLEDIIFGRWPCERSSEK